MSKHNNNHNNIDHNSHSKASSEHSDELVINKIDETQVELETKVTDPEIVIEEMVNPETVDIVNDTNKEENPEVVEELKVESNLPEEQETKSKNTVEESENANAAIIEESVPKETNVEPPTMESNTSNEQTLDGDYVTIDKSTTNQDEPTFDNAKLGEKSKEDYIYEKADEKSNNLLLKTLCLVAGLAALGYIIFNIGGQDKKPATSNNQTTTSIVDKKPCINNNQKMDIPKNLKIEDTLVGTGKEVFTGCQIKIHYKGYLVQTQEELDAKSEPKEFDNSFKRGTPFSTQIGVGKLIKGWDIGIIGMKEGGKRKLTIPADLAYGAIEIPGIPANSTLVFEVELIQVLD